MKSPPSPRVAAIFDMDDTLLSGSSGRMLIDYLRQQERLSEFVRRRDLPGFILTGLLYRLGVIDATRLLQRMSRASAGWDAAELWAISRSWFADMVVHAISTRAQERLIWHQDQGHIPIICSGSSQFAVKLVAEHLGIEDSIYTEWLIEQGRLTGKLRQPLTYGSGKVYWIERWAEERDVDLKASYFYTDHISDLPLLERVGYPVAVNPDRRLSRLAQRREWPIEEWIPAPAASSA